MYHESSLITFPYQENPNLGLHVIQMVYVTPTDKSIVSNLCNLSYLSCKNVYIQYERR